MANVTDEVSDLEEEPTAMAEEEDEEEDQYIFIFGNDINPLDFVDNNVDSSLLYQQFETIEQEAKKRKATEECHRERGRGKRLKNKTDPELTRMMGNATLRYAVGKYDEAKDLAREVIKLAPNVAESYHTLGLVWIKLQDYDRAMRFYLIAAHLKPEWSPLWEQIFDWSKEQGYVDQALYCLLKAITADPKNFSLRYQLARFYCKLKDYQKAAVTYEKIYQLCPENDQLCLEIVRACRENDVPLQASAMFYKKCGQVKRFVCSLEDYLKSHTGRANVTVVDLLCTIRMETKEHDRALQYIKEAQAANALEELPLNLKIKAGICHAHLGEMDKAQVLFNDLKPENASEHVDLVIEVADSLMGLEHYSSAVNYYLMLEENIGNKNKASNDDTTTSILRPLNLDDFVQSKTKVGPSVAHDATTMTELRKWNEMYGEGGNRTKSPFGFGS